MLKLKKNLIIYYYFHSISMIEFLIIGSGFAGAVSAIHLIDNGVNPKNITIVGPTKVGCGNAYECDHTEFRLNVSSEIMWINPEKKLEFTEWAKLNIHDPIASHFSGKFYKRNDFAKFVYSKLEKYLINKQLSHQKRTVMRIYKNEKDKWGIILDNKKKLFSKNIILATGNPKPKWPCLVEKVLKNNHESLFENPWDGQWISRINKNEKILIIGSGLSALDCLSVLKHKGHKGAIVLVSRSGEFPPTQAKWERKNNPKWPGSLNEPLLPSIMINFIKNYLPNKPYSSSEWQSSWEELRLDINLNWNRISDRGKIKLKRNFYSLWSRLRYRASPQSIKAKNYFQDKGQLIVYRGYAEKIINEKNTLNLKLHDGRKIASDKIINCSGKGRDFLIDQIIKDKMGIPDIFNETLQVDKEFSVLPYEGMDNKGLYLIGPSLVSSNGDIAAASKVSLQGISLVNSLLGS